MSQRAPSLLAAALHGLAVGAGASAMTAACFLVLPLLQAIQEGPAADLTLSTVDAAVLPPPPPPPPEQEPEEEPEPEEAPPDLAEETPLLDLAQLELALGSLSGGGWGAGELAVDLDRLAATAEAAEALVSIADLDQRPRVVHQPGPLLTPELRRKVPATVTVLFVVDPSGRVEDPSVQKSTDPAFERAALAAVAQWRFDPGTRDGQPVRFRMRVPITFPEEPRP